MDNNHLLTDIEIKDFKCFKDFKVNGLKRVNLIGGKNNVGKTAFMEACYVNVSSDNIDHIFRSLATVSLQRNITEYLQSKFHKKLDKNEQFENNEYYYSESNIRIVISKVLYGAGIKEYSFTINNEITQMNANEFSVGKSNLKNNINFIANFNIPNLLLKHMFIALQKKKKEEILSDYLNKFDSNIEEFIVLGDSPSCKVKDIDDYRDINEFGDGLKHFIFIICSLYASENGYLFIDEIGNGIHYTQLDRLWEIILTVAKDQNVQVFATTHSLEMINAYARVSEKLEEKALIEKDDICFIELGKDKQDKLKSMVYPYDWFLDEISQNHELRGW